MNYERAHLFCALVWRSHCISIYGSNPDYGLQVQPPIASGRPPNLSPERDYVNECAERFCQIVGETFERE